MMASAKPSVTQTHTHTPTVARTYASTSVQLAPNWHHSSFLEAAFDNDGHMAVRCFMESNLIPGINTSCLSAKPVFNLF